MRKYEISDSWEVDGKLMVIVDEYSDLALANTRANKKYKVAILGATGTVVQRFIQLLEDHPRFEMTALAASDRSQGKAYGDACSWRLPGKIPPAVKQLIIQPPPPLDCDFVFSSLPADVAHQTENDFARVGYPVISNSSAHRLDADVPLLIPEVNHEHLSLLEKQRAERGYARGFIVTNPNCSTIVLALALAPLALRGSGRDRDDHASDLWRGLPRSFCLGHLR